MKLEDVNNSVKKDMKKVQSLDVFRYVKTARMETVLLLKNVDVNLDITIP